MDKNLQNYFKERLGEQMSTDGTGARGFSIKLSILGEGEISLCTIYRNKTIDFSLKR